MTHPVVTLRSLRVVDSLSDETTCFSATVYVDGKRAGFAENRGHGGCTLVRITDPAVRARVEAYGRTLIPDEYKSALSVSTGGQEWLVGQLVEQALKAKDEARLAKIDAREKARFAAHGLITVRLTMGSRITWFGCKPGEEATQAKLVAIKHKATADQWEVVQ